jgi:hypothetical protein
MHPLSFLIFPNPDKFFVQTRKKNRKKRNNRELTVGPASKDVHETTSAEHLTSQHPFCTAEHHLFIFLETKTPVVFLQWYAASLKNSKIQ